MTAPNVKSDINSQIIATPIKKPDAHSNGRILTSPRHQEETRLKRKKPVTWTGFKLFTQIAYGIEWRRFSDIKCRSSSVF